MRLYAGISTSAPHNGVTDRGPRPATGTSRQVVCGAQRGADGASAMALAVRRRNRPLRDARDRHRQPHAIRSELYRRGAKARKLLLREHGDTMLSRVNQRRHGTCVIVHDLRSWGDRSVRRAARPGDTPLTDCPENGTAISEAAADRGPPDGRQRGPQPWGLLDPLSAVARAYVAGREADRRSRRRVRISEEVEHRFRPKWNIDFGGSGTSIPGSGTRISGCGTCISGEVERRFRSRERSSVA